MTASACRSVAVMTFAPTSTRRSRWGRCRSSWRPSAWASSSPAHLSIARAPRPRIAPLRRVPWWGWLGGLAGAIYVTAVFSLIPEIGAAPTIALTVSGQQLASVLVDRFGLFACLDGPSRDCGSPPSPRCSSASC